MEGRCNTCKNHCITVVFFFFFFFFFDNLWHKNLKKKETLLVTLTNRRCCQFQTSAMTERNLDCFTHTTSRKSTKLFTRNLCHVIRPCLAPAKLDTILCNQHVLVQMCAQVSYSIRLTEFSCKQLCWFPGCAVKKSRFRPVFGGVLN